MSIDFSGIALKICVQRRGQNSNMLSMFSRPEYIRINNRTSVKVNPIPSKSSYFSLWFIIFFSIVLKSSNGLIHWLLDESAEWGDFSILFLLLDKSGGRRWSPAMVYCQAPRRVDSEACPFAAAPAVYPEVLQFLCSGDSCCSSASGSSRRQPVDHTCLVQYHR